MSNVARVANFQPHLKNIFYHPLLSVLKGQKWLILRKNVKKQLFFHINLMGTSLLSTRVKKHSKKMVLEFTFNTRNILMFLNKKYPQLTTIFH
jgi:hypothetical protein